MTAVAYSPLSKKSWICVSADDTDLSVLLSIKDSREAIKQLEECVKGTM